ncbi:MAG: hypothetical protein ABIZ91_19300 [Gemmatimonadaceae bacterium]
MLDTTAGSTPTRSFWIISGLALLWNLIGVATYLMSVTMSPETIAAMPESERALYANVPAWVTSAYAIAVFGGTLASVGLLMRKSWATPLFVLSLIGIVVQMGHALLGTRLLEVKGASAAVLPVVLTVIAIYLVKFSTSAKQKGLLR